MTTTSEDMFNNLTSEQKKIVEGLDKKIKELNAECHEVYRQKESINSEQLMQGHEWTQAFYDKMANIRDEIMVLEKEKEQMNMVEIFIERKL